jgi:hypothetical protein
LPADWNPELKFNVRAGIPAAYAADEEIRLNLYARLARLRDPNAIEEKSGANSVQAVERRPIGRALGTLAFGVGL